MPLRLFILLVVTTCSMALAAPVSAPVRAEIDALLASLGSSGCDFNRNGSWHRASEAKSHLLRKLEYLEGKNLVATTEQFIELAASSSSSSGKPYQVKCSGGAAIESRSWMLSQLKVVRASSRAASGAK